MNEPSALRMWLWDHPIWRCGCSSEDGVLFVKVYRMKGCLYPFRWVYWFGRRLHDAKWWLLWRFHPNHRYFMVNTGLPPGYYDFDSRILHACMAMLCEFVKYDYHEPIPEALAIHHWWIVEKPADEARREELLIKCYGRPRTGTESDHTELRRLEEKIDGDETAMLHRLMDIRPGLWT